jgi:ornithine cyclodeaminase
VLHISSEELRARVPFDAAVRALREAFSDLSAFVAPQRTIVGLEAGDLLLMPAAGGGRAGVKVVTVVKTNRERGLPVVHAVYLLLDAATLAPIALIDGEGLTALRTSALSALATSYCARPDARHLLLFGAGTQARAHLEAMCSVRPIERVTVVSRSPEPAQSLVEEATRLGLDGEVGTPTDVAAADIICTCTTSPDPVFDGSLVRSGTHVNAVGSYTPTARETDDELVKRAKVVVEDVAVALAEAGDIVIPVASGALEADDLIELSGLVGGVEVRETGDEVTFFKSVGAAFEDLAVAKEVC